jgi:putative flavoprotein involved in K+ transport
VHTIDTVVIGAGHAGLATSRLLGDVGVEHVVLDRGRLAERWRSERWDSLRMLTPNWLARLPGWHYTGPDPDGYMSAADLVDYLRRYASAFDAPVEELTDVVSVAATDTGYEVVTDTGTWRADHVVVATGQCGAPVVPPVAAGLDADVHVLHASAYRRPEVLPPGGVLVVGASSSGVQIADELVRAGREVVLSVGRHTRMPRAYRGLDVFSWLERTGRLARTIAQVPDPAAARREPSMQLVGRRPYEDLDLPALAGRGVRLAGRLVQADGARLRFADDLAYTVAQAETRMHRFLDTVDDRIRLDGLTRSVLGRERPAPAAPVAVGAPERLDLGCAGIGTVVLATGYRPHHPWLKVPVTDPDGTVHQHRGITPAPGLYVVGQRFQHRRDSGFLDGTRHDARAVVEHLASRSGRRARAHAAMSA